MILEATIFDAQGVRTINQDGQQLVQVYDGYGVQLFCHRYNRAIGFTETLLEMIRSERFNMGIHEFLVSSLRRAINNADPSGILTDIRQLREVIKAKLPKGHDLRMAACIAEVEWKVAFDG